MRGSYSGNTLAFQAKAESSILLPRSITCKGGRVVQCTRLQICKTVGSNPTPYSMTHYEL